MKSFAAALAAIAIPLLFYPPALHAGELPFNAPAIQATQEKGELLHRAARALYDLPADATLPTGGKDISDLWLFPTGDGDTLFARYTLRSNGGSPQAEHLAVLTLEGDHIARLLELTDASAEPSADCSVATTAPTASRGPS